ncbi:hypothetical protein Tco_0088161 [Tanacetum coccineum]
MSAPKFADSHNMVVFLAKPTESDGFEQILDFLNTNPIKFALTVNPTIYTSCIEQFWATVKTSVRRDLQLEDAEGIECLPNADIIEQLALIGYEKPSQKLTFYKAFFSSQWKFLIHTILQCLSAKSIAWNEFSITMASAIICLATNQKFNFSKYIFESIVKNVDSSVKFLMYQSGLTEPIADEAVNEENVPTQSNDPPLSRVNTLGSGKDRLKLKELMDLFIKLSDRVLDLETTKIAQAKEVASLKKRVKKLEKKRNSKIPGMKRLFKIGRSAQVVSSENEGLSDQEDASKQERKTDDINKDAEVTLVDQRYDDAQMFNTYIFNGEEVFVAKQSEKVVEEVVSTAEVIEEEEQVRLVREKAEKVEEANISWDNVQAMIKANRLLAERLQAREQEELTDEEKAILFVELLEKRKKHFAALRAQEKRNKPPTKAQKKSTMSTYLKHMAGYKQSQLKNKSFAEIQKLFDKAMTRVNMFVDKDTELVKESSKKAEAEMAQESSLKRAGEELEQEKEKKQKIDDDQEEAEMKKLIKVVPDEEEVAITIPLATKPPSIVDWKIAKEGKISLFQIIRANGSSKRYSSMIQMLKYFDREDLETLWKLVKAKHGNTRPEEGYERVLWGDLRIMFEHNIEDTV